MSTQAIPIDADELAALRRDAERYRWIRVKDGEAPELIDDWDLDGAESEELDAAIDAEIAKAAP